MVKFASDVAMTDTSILAILRPNYNWYNNPM